MARTMPGNQRRLIPRRMHRPAVAGPDARVVAFEVVDGSSADAVTALQTLLTKTRAILGSLQHEVAVMNGLLDSLLQAEAAVVLDNDLLDSLLPPEAAIVLDNGHVVAWPVSNLGHALEDVLDE